MEFLERVVRQHGGVDLLGDLEDERIAAADGSGGRGDEFTGEQRRLVLGSLGLIDTVGERGIDDDGDRVDLVLGHEGGDRVVELTQAGEGAALGGDVGAIDHHMGSDHGGFSSLPLGDCRSRSEWRR